jgi:predicted tellurium resistance membrane protein TerC
MLPTMLLRLIFLFTLACLTTARAEQFVLFDVTFTFTQEDALNSKPS